MRDPCSAERPYGPLDAFHTAKPGNSEGSVMNIALNPEAIADKSRETYPKTNGQFEAAFHVIIEVHRDPWR